MARHINRAKSRFMGRSYRIIEHTSENRRLLWNDGEMHAVRGGGWAKMPVQNRKSASEVLAELRSDPRFFSGVTAWKKFEAKEGRYAELPPELHPGLTKALSSRGVSRLYSHQREAFDLASSGKHVCVVTPTASGKTLCYNLPVLNAILNDPSTCALYLFPTKALAQDQLAEMQELARAGGFEVRSHTFDGDTPSAKRKLARETGQVIITNPDMLHQAILPHHPSWVRMFSSLKYVVIDEMHGYRGVFGSHVALVIRRLRRIASFYGVSPVFILASATIANPGELAGALTGLEVTVVDKNGAPSSSKEFVFYNPPALTPDGSVRQSAIDAASRLASKFVNQGVQTIVFSRSRIAVELLVQYMRSSYPAKLERERERIQGYRGGYLPSERRAIEKGLREGKIVGVAATNALELGIDIGSLDCAIMAGYPGTIASTWQQAGRAGRRSGSSVALLIAGASALDQFIVNHPDYFFAQTPEYGLISPENRYILGDHAKCAAFELPFRDDPSDERLCEIQVSSILSELENQGILFRSQGRWNWSSDSFPAASISLRSATNQNFVVVDQTNGAEVIGEVDWASAPMLIHKDAIYMHRGEQYQVLHLDYNGKKAYVKKVKVDYYTDANLSVGVKVISTDSQLDGPFHPCFGELSVTALTTIFKKIKLFTHENVGSGEIALPEMNMHTQGMWFSLPDHVVAGLDPRNLGSVLSGLANIVLNIAPLFLMCDKKDLGTAVEVRSPLDGKPTVYLYDSYPGGVGLSERAFQIIPSIMRAGYELVSECKCLDGCPGCVGPSGEVGEGTKDACARILREFLGGRSNLA